MYNGIGLSSAKGSGTNGFIQRNASFVNPKRQTRRSNEYGTQKARASKIVDSKSDPKLVLHEKKRRIELKCFNLRKELESRGREVADIDAMISDLRNDLLKELGNEFPEPISSPGAPNDSAINQRNEKLMKAFGIDKETYKEGAVLERTYNRQKSVVSVDANDLDIGSEEGAINEGQYAFKPKQGDNDLVQSFQNRSGSEHSNSEESAGISISSRQQHQAKSQFRSPRRRYRSESRSLSSSRVSNDRHRSISSSSSGSRSVRKLHRRDPEPRSKRHRSQSSSLSRSRSPKHYRRTKPARPLKSSYSNQSQRSRSRSFSRSRSPRRLIRRRSGSPDRTAKRSYSSSLSRSRSPRRFATKRSGSPNRMPKRSYSRSLSRSRSPKHRRHMEKNQDFSSRDVYGRDRVNYNYRTRQHPQRGRTYSRNHSFSKRH